MARKKVRKLKITRGEKILYGCAIFCGCCTILLKVFCGATIGNLDMNVEELRYDITGQEKKVESLSMKMSELTSFDNVKEIVKGMGLAYNNNNIVVVNK